MYYLVQTVYKLQCNASLLHIIMMTIKHCKLNFNKRRTQKTESPTQNKLFSGIFLI